MGSVAPQWLAGAIDDALVNLDATVPAKEREAEVERILSAWEQNVGPFAGLRFLSAMFEKLDLLDGPSSDSDLLRLVMAYRVTQVAGGWENAQEAASSLGIVPPETLPTDHLTPSDDEEAEALQERLLRLGIPGSTVARAKDLLRQLRRRQPDDDDFDAKILADADLSVLSTPPQDYKKLIASLYAHGEDVDPEEFFRARRKFVKRLLARSNIFYTPVAAWWDEAARTNLEAELAVLDSKLSASEAEDDLQESPPDKDKPSNKTLIVRTSLAKKLKGSNRTGEAETPTRTSALLRTPSLTTEDSSEEEEDFSSTSTLESVADLIERTRRQRRDSE